MEKLDSRAHGLPHLLKVPGIPKFRIPSSIFMGEPQCGSIPLPQLSTRSPGAAAEACWGMSLAWLGSRVPRLTFIVWWFLSARAPFLENRGPQDLQCHCQLRTSSQRVLCSLCPGWSEPDCMHVLPLPQAALGENVQLRICFVRGSQ